MIGVVFFATSNHLQAQYTTESFKPSALMSEGLKAPGKLAIDTNDDVYVTDAIQKNIVKFDAQGNYIKTIETSLSPISIAINSKNQLFVVDKITSSIYRLHENGTNTLLYKGASRPSSIVFGKDDLLYLVDSDLKNVLGIDRTGNIVVEFTHEAFTYPSGIAYDKENNHIIVSEHGGIGDNDQYCRSGSWMVSSWGPNMSIYTFDTSGNLLNSFGCFGSQDGRLQRTQGITVGACGNIYVVDPYLGRVSVFDKEGNYITRFGQQGNAPGDFNLPIDIVFTSDNHAIVSSMNKGTVDVFVITGTLPTATITSEDQTICADSEAIITVNFTGNAPWTFRYTVDGINPVEVTTDVAAYNFTVSEAGIYEITSLVDINTVIGTCFTGSTNITVDPLPTATILSADFSKCYDDETGVSVAFTGMAPWTFTYTIDDLNPVEVTTSESLYMIKAPVSGKYEIITLADARCSVTNLTENRNVTVYPLPTVSITNEKKYARIKPGESVDFTISFTGTAPYTFMYANEYDPSGLVEEGTITTNESTYTFTLTEPGSYEIVNITDRFCTNMKWQGFYDVLPVVLAEATMATSTIEVCSGTSDHTFIGFIGKAPWTFSYTIDGLNPTEITTSSTPYSLAVSMPGIYELSAVSDVNGSGTFSGLTTVSELAQPLITLPTMINSCVGENTLLDPGVFDSYLWSTGETTQTINVTVAGNYSVSVTDVNGCNATATVQVVMNTLPSVNLASVIDLCEEDGSVLLNPGVYQSYEWSTGSTDRILEVDSSGIYSVRVTNSNGCSLEASVEVIVHEPTIADFTFDVNKSMVQFMSTAANAVAHYWDFGDGNTSTEENPSHIYNNKGYYNVSYTAINEYCNDATVFRALHIRYTAKEEVISVYPNPSKGPITLKMSPSEPFNTTIHITVSSFSGHVIYSAYFDPNVLEQYNGSYYKKINLSAFSKGIYIISVRSGDFITQEKIILK